MRGARARLAVLVSGRGTNLQAILDATRAPEYPAEVVVVVSDRPGAYALERARQAGVPAYVVPWRRDLADFGRRLAEVLDAHQAQWVCLAGFLRILPPEFVQRYRGRILNIHPSLLPAFGGRGMYGERVHQAVLASGAVESGCTVHFVTEDVDAGPVVAQARVPVLPDDTVETLAARVAEQEHRLYPEAIRRVVTGQVRFDDLVAAEQLAR
ncbi:MAG: phosphoribosylglycinamide formyltransferase [Armatimonadota bacterium]|nr:phosphoribosylglycinamide formyltransferase [Armatimonadota bacterium]MDR7410735.1 phosphoribosylglycinamide formyltransferase [Armatimonadota bacterium]